MTMFSRMFPLLVGALYILYQVFAQESFTAELMIQSNVSLNTSEIMAAISVTSLEVTDNHGNGHTVYFDETELVAECILAGEDTNCECSVGYVWSDNICYGYSCCRETACAENVSSVAPLCVPKVTVYLVGLLVSAGEWTEDQKILVEDEINRLNAVENLNISYGGTSMNFEVIVGLPPEIGVFEEIMGNLTAKLGPDVAIQIEGMAAIDAPTEPVCYLSDPQLNCTLMMETEKATWKIDTPDGEIELNSGTVVTVNSHCDTAPQTSCATLLLTGATSIWTGNYTCEFMKGMVTYKAKTYLEVAPLPDRISMSVLPLTADCTTGHSTTDVVVTATIPLSTAEYSVFYSFRGSTAPLINQTVNNQVVYKFQVDIDCLDNKEPQVVEVTFQNFKDQKQSSKLEIQVVYADSKYCEEDNAEEVLWPKTPFKVTVVDHGCPEGRTGYKTRTCDGPLWMDVFNYCTNDQLNNVLQHAEVFLMGQGPTSDVAKTIFRNLKNSSSFASDSNSNTADVNVSIHIFDRMARASDTTILQDNVLPVAVEVASQILNTNWTGVNDTVLSNMSANYLEAVERLVNNIPVNTSRELKTENVELKICENRDCNVTVFNVEVSLNRSRGRPKVMAVKNLASKLVNSFPNADRTAFLLSATLGFDRDRNGTKRNYSSAIDIHMEFPLPVESEGKPLCVFWNVTTRAWSEEGCNLTSRGKNTSTCHCNHLTSFSVLMSKSDTSTVELDIITYIGLSVSICCLVIFLVIEFLVWSAVVKTNLSHFRHTAIVNIAIFRLLADCSFLASSSPEKLSDGFCLALTLCKHLFYTAMFCWMLCLSVMLVHQLIFVFNPLRKRVFLFLSSIVGYLVPIIIVGSSYVYYRYTSQPYNDEKCWLKFDRLLEGSIHAFLIPVFVIILMNIFSMVVVIVTLVKTQTPDSGKANDKETVKSIVKVLVVLAPVFGVTWGLGFFLLLLNTKDPLFIVVIYSFTILNSFQGLFILFAGCIAEQKVREEIIKIVTGKGNSDSTKSVSTVFSKDK